MNLYFIFVCISWLGNIPLLLLLIIKTFVSYFTHTQENKIATGIINDEGDEEDVEILKGYV